MGFILIAIAVIIIAASVAFLGTDGLWHNVIMFFNVLVAAVLAVNFYEPAAAWLDWKAHTFSYFWDFLSLWAIFSVSLIAFRLLTDFASKVKVRFHPLVDQIGGYAMSLWTGWLIACFTIMTLHTAPLAQNSFGGAFQPTPETRMLMFGPDRQWLAFMHRLSQPRSLGRGEAGTESDQPRFDPQGEFILKYAARRAALEKEKALRIQRKWGQTEEQSALP